MPGSDTAVPAPTTEAITHICVCICTYKRPAFLRRLLDALADQDTGGLFTYSIVVADNDRLESARALVSELSATSPVPITYCVEPRQNIALARNKALDHARGDAVAFIDDDEFPTRQWLRTLVAACQAYGVDGVIGPVRRHFDEQPPAWIVRGNFYERETYPTGRVIDWRMGRTNNVLVRRRIIPAHEPAFRPEFLTGEDQDFFRRMIEDKHVFVWCNEAVVYEVVPPVRWRRSFMLRRALLRGKVSPLDPGFGVRDIAKSLVAVPLYTGVLPFALLLGHHRFMACLVSLCDHLGRLLALLGVNPVTEPYVTE
jgi:succinoglycan biosynthesis protein ExoM